MQGRTGIPLLLTGVLLAGCGTGGPAYEQAPPAGTDATVETTTTLNFSPERVVIPAGGTVQWRNTSLVTHTVTAVPAMAEDANNVALPEGAEPFNSGDIAPGQVYSHTFDVPGEYRYFCQPHDAFGMVGTVVVTPAS